MANNVTVIDPATLRRYEQILACVDISFRNEPGTFSRYVELLQRARSVRGPQLEHVVHPVHDLMENE